MANFEELKPSPPHTDGNPSAGDEIPGSKSQSLSSSMQIIQERHDDENDEKSSNGDSDLSQPSNDGPSPSNLSKLKVSGVSGSRAKDFEHHDLKNSENDQKSTENLHDPGHDSPQLQPGAQMKHDVHSEQPILSKSPPIDPNPTVHSMDSLSLFGNSGDFDLAAQFSKMMLGDGDTVDIPMDSAAAHPHSDIVDDIQYGMGQVDRVDDIENLNSDVFPMKLQPAFPSVNPSSHPIFSTILLNKPTTPQLTPQPQPHKPISVESNPFNYHQLTSYEEHRFNHAKYHWNQNITHFEATQYINPSDAVQLPRNYIKYRCDLLISDNLRHSIDDFDSSQNHQISNQTTKSQIKPLNLKTDPKQTPISSFTPYSRQMAVQRQMTAWKHTINGHFRVSGDTITYEEGVECGIFVEFELSQSQREDIIITFPYFPKIFDDKDVPMFRVRCLSGIDPVEYGIKPPTHFRVPRTRERVIPSREDNVFVWNMPGGYIQLLSEVVQDTTQPNVFFATLSGGVNDQDLYDEVVIPKDQFIELPLSQYELFHNAQCEVDEKSEVLPDKETQRGAGHGRSKLSIDTKGSTDNIIQSAVSKPHRSQSKLSIESAITSQSLKSPSKKPIYHNIHESTPIPSKRAHKSIYRAHKSQMARNMHPAKRHIWERAVSHDVDSEIFDKSLSNFAREKYKESTKFLSGFTSSDMSTDSVDTDCGPKRVPVQKGSQADTKSGPSSMVGSRGRTQNPASPTMRPGKDVSQKRLTTLSVPADPPAQRRNIAAGDPQAALNKGSSVKGLSATGIPQARHSKEWDCPKRSVQLSTELAVTDLHIDRAASMQSNISTLRSQYRLSGSNQVPGGMDGGMDVADGNIGADGSVAQLARSRIPGGRSGDRNRAQSMSTAPSNPMEADKDVDDDFDVERSGHDRPRKPPLPKSMQQQIAKQSLLRRQLEYQRKPMVSQNMDAVYDVRSDDDRPIRSLIQREPTQRSRSGHRIQSERMQYPLAPSTNRGGGHSRRCQQCQQPFVPVPCTKHTGQLTRYCQSCRPTVPTGQHGDGQRSQPPHGDQSGDRRDGYDDYHGNDVNDYDGDGDDYDGYDGHGGGGGDDPYQYQWDSTQFHKYERKQALKPYQPQFASHLYPNNSQVQRDVLRERRRRTSRMSDKFIRSPIYAKIMIAVKFIEKEVAPQVKGQQLFEAEGC